MSIFKATSKQKKVNSNTFKSTKNKSYDPSTVYSWEQTNKSSFKSLESYYNKINNKEYLNEDDFTLFRKELDNYIDSTNRLRGLNGTYTTEQEQAWQDQISAMNDYYNSWSSFYGGYENEDEYNLYSNDEYKQFFDAIQSGDLEGAESFLNEKTQASIKTDTKIDWLGTMGNVLSNAVLDGQQGVKHEYRTVREIPEEIQEYWGILNYYKNDKAYKENNADYLALMQNEDFADKSKYTPTKTGSREIDWLGTIGNAISNAVLDGQQGVKYEYKGGMGYDDILYDIINGNTEAKNYLDEQSINDFGALAMASGLTSSDYLTMLTDDEKGIFNYIYATQGKEKAYEYFSHLENNYLNQRNRAAIEKKWAEANPVISSLGTVALAPARGFSYLASFSISPSAI